MELKRVVVTGLGTLNPIGNNINEYWNNLEQGVSGAEMITSFDTAKFKTKFACQVKNFDALQHFDRKELRKYDLYCQYAMVSAHEAFLDSGLDLEKIDHDAAGVIWASGIGGIQTFMEEMRGYFAGDGTPRFSPFFIPKMIADIASGHISIRYGFRGPNYSTVSACASSTHALIDALNLIRLGQATIMLTGGSEASVNEAGMGGFNAMQAISTNNDEYKTASRPFDVTRDGFVMGEGAGALILEEYEHAKARGAKIYAELAGGGMTADAHHFTAPHPEGLGAKNVMINTLKNANLKLEDVDYINVHGTATPLGDIAEIKAITSVFGEHAYKLSVSSTKSMTGHLLGATGAIEAIAAIFAINKGIVPPTINHANPDPEIDPKVDLTLNKAKKREVNVALSNTFGFGGHNSSVVFKKFSE
ncbi:MAG: beta-ketoacyl-ACP synthase II [Tenuifilaceae bacterium]|jgi:3-oxoacyl-[acyl-carrier-protein] synthase II|uniref:beta-ketoacyl-ACP synthase II n=1 Tax=Perlabentimonas gracilis TaxID=2715279 RepID=UPI00140DBA48|nr:beta-ketoacyl-ACP synthase II [Perlabentimonas gracilis]MDX9770246.1 beta-ketoacyl-ACP synthase II [Tenuifilaceae bacterium]NHB69941.1 beta-ketoacyl-ACP synthase II [Perlabentimonas gracilis]